DDQILHRAESPHCQNTNGGGAWSCLRKRLWDVDGHITDIGCPTVDRLKLRDSRSAVDPDRVHSTNACNVANSLAPIPRVQAPHPTTGPQSALKCAISRTI